MTPVGTSIFAFVYQPPEQSPVVALTTCVMVVDATAVEGEYSSGPNVARPINAGMVKTPARPDTANAREFLRPMNAVGSFDRNILMRELQDNACQSLRGDGHVEGRGGDGHVQGRGGDGHVQGRGGAMQRLIPP
jgi:hypothetical protein